MNEMIHLLIPFAGGLLLGLIFFGGLWLTVARAVRFSNPAPWFLGSLLLRSVLVVAGFLLIGGGELLHFLAALAGFVATKITMMKTIGIPKAYGFPQNKEP